MGMRRRHVGAASDADRKQAKVRRTRLSQVSSDITQPARDFDLDSMLRAQERPLGATPKEKRAVDKLVSKRAEKKRPLPPPLPFE